MRASIFRSRARGRVSTRCFCAAALWLLALSANAETSELALRAPTAALDREVESHWWVAAELHFSVLSNLVERSTVNISFGYAGKFGYRWQGDWGLYLHVEHNLWTETEIAMNVRQGAFDVGVGVERMYFQRRMRAALALGPAILLYDTALDDAGAAGIFVDVRPTGVRWPVGRSFVVTLDPLTFTLVAPTLGGIPLVQIQYRTALAVEYDFSR
jgi:hypothetical protein